MLITAYITGTLEGVKQQGRLVSGREKENVTVQLKRLGQSSKNIKVLDGFFWECLACSRSSDTFSMRKSSHCPKRVVNNLSIDGVTEAPVHLAILCSRDFLTFRTKEISFANRYSWVYHQFPVKKTKVHKIICFQTISCNRPNFQLKNLFQQHIERCQLIWKSLVLKCSF